MYDTINIKNMNSIFNLSNDIITTATIKIIMYSRFSVNIKYKKLVAICK